MKRVPSPKSDLRQPSYFMAVREFPVQVRHDFLVHLLLEVQFQVRASSQKEADEIAARISVNDNEVVISHVSAGN